MERVSLLPILLSVVNRALRFFTFLPDLQQAGVCADVGLAGLWSSLVIVCADSATKEARDVSLKMVSTCP